MLLPLAYRVMLAPTNQNLGLTLPLKQKLKGMLLWKFHAPLKEIRLPGYCQKVLKTIASDVPLKHTKLRTAILLLIGAEDQFLKAFNTITTDINLLAILRNLLSPALTLDNNRNHVLAL